MQAGHLPESVSMSAAVVGKFTERIECLFVVSLGFPQLFQNLVGDNLFCMDLAGGTEPFYSAYLNGKIGCR